MTLPTVLLPGGGRTAIGVICPGHTEPYRMVCGQAVTKPGKCSYCHRVMSQAEFAAAIDARAEREAA